MQIQPVNNNNGTNFGAIKGIKYSGQFNPKYYLTHAKIVDKALNSNAIEKFSNKYDFILNFEIFKGPVSKNYINHLHFEPVPKKQENGCINKITKFFKNLFKKEEPKESSAENLPCKFSTCSDSNKSYIDASEIFYNDIVKLTEESINKDFNTALDKKLLKNAKHLLSN